MKIPQMDFVRSLSLSLSSSDRKRSLRRVSTNMEKDESGMRMNFVRQLSFNSTRMVDVSMRYVLRRVKSIPNQETPVNPEDMRAGLDDSVELFEVETPTIVSTEELYDVIEALAQVKDGESCTIPVLTDKADVKKEIAKVNEFWRLINNRRPKAAYDLIWDDIQSIQQHWALIAPNVSNRRIKKANASTQIRRNLTV